MLRYYVLMFSVNKDILRCLDTCTYPGMSKKNCLHRYHEIISLRISGQIIIFH